MTYAAAVRGTRHTVSIYPPAEFLSAAARKKISDPRYSSGENFSL
jgi:hypothetical protein